MEERKSRIDTRGSLVVAEVAAKKMKLDLVTTIQKRDASYATVTEARDNYDKQLAKLRPDIYQEGLMACLKELDIPVDHPAWTKATPEVELLNSLESYSLLFLLGFIEEEYMNQPAKKDGKEDATEKGVELVEVALGEEVGEVATSQDIPRAILVFAL
ncbi:hypothetical protein Acr_00g0064260 [Actinidia rufa]|uniref:Uncharacterized protein n=1 Tax=Actinidia rufa TaxID=165716 RepID=A0A7J0DPP3_9ERIC|nr:hypothetical protein Acr_00g0064260 [Actinidia rufa]